MRMYVCRERYVSSLVNHHHHHRAGKPMGGTRGKTTHALDTERGGLAAVSVAREITKKYFLKILDKMT